MASARERLRQKTLRFRSLRARLLLAATVVMSAFFLLTGAALEGAFRESVLQAQEDKLEGLVYVLLAATAFSEDGNLTISTANVPESLKQPASGLRAALFDDSGKPVWKSASYVDVPPPRPVGVNEWDFERLEQPDVFALSYGIRWINVQDDPQRYTLQVIEDTANFERQLAAYRRSLMAWLLLSGIGLIAAQAILLRWGTAPLKRLAGELAGVEGGSQSQIDGAYPTELQPLIAGLNAMIRNERNQQTRYRDALSDLAHSLKTPMAVMRGHAEDGSLPPDKRRLLCEQLELMQKISNVQLRKAAAAGRRTLSEPVPVEPMVKRLTAALAKVYADKSLRFDVNDLAQLRLRVDAGDLYELLGNLLDNAARYGHGTVRLRIWREEASGIIRIEDDGPGFPANIEDQLRRGVRADSHQPGQGIGLAAVHALVKAYEGELELTRSELGGACVTAQLPA